MEERLYRLKNVGLCYHKAQSLPWHRQSFWALHDVSFDVFKGDSIGIIGKNGAGKSSLLRIIAGIVKSDRGLVECKPGLNVSLQSLNAGFNPMLSGRHNIYLSGLILGIAKKEIKKRVDEIIEMSELEAFIDEPVKNYSNGMRARLGFSIAYFMNPDVLLIDEALAVGDPPFREKSSALIREKISKEGCTAIIVSHALPILRGVCNRIIQIESGTSLPEMSVEESLRIFNASPNRKA